jgi:hypothetical protein
MIERARRWQAAAGAKVRAIYELALGRAPSADESGARPPRISPVRRGE